MGFCNIHFVQSLWLVAYLSDMTESVFKRLSYFGFRLGGRSWFCLFWNFHAVNNFHLREQVWGSFAANDLWRTNTYRQKSDPTIPVSDNIGATNTGIFFSDILSKIPVYRFVPIYLRTLKYIYYIFIYTSTSESRYLQEKRLFLTLILFENFRRQSRVWLFIKS